MQPIIARRRLAHEFSQANPLVVKTLGGDAYTLTDWGTVRNLHAALAKRYPAELGGGGGPRSFELRALSDNAVISPEYGGPGRQRLLSGEVGCDQLVLTFIVAATPSGGAKPAADSENDAALRIVD